MPRFGARVKQFLAEQLWLPPAMSWGSWVIGPGRTGYDYAREIGDGLNSSVLMSVIFWLMRACPEAQLVVRERKRGADEPVVVVGHPLVTLVERPNDYYAGDALWMGTMWSWCIFGNAYWRVVASRGGEPRELWWVPPWQIVPAYEPSGRAFISHYRYTPEGSGSTVIELPREQVLHFRHGLDPRNPRLGLSPLLSIAREIWTDAEAVEWVAALLRNMAVPGLLITPKGDESLSPDEVVRVKAYISSRFTGDHRGEPLAMGQPTDVQKISHNPSEMDLSVVHNTAEERVCAIYGVPAAVIGFGTGLENSKVGATMREFVGLAWSNGLIPPQRIMASEIERNLLPRYETRLDRFGVGWDYSRVQALQEDEGTRLTRYNMGVQGGWVKVSEARAAMNLPVTPDDEIYLRSSSVTAVDPEEQILDPSRIPAPLRAIPERTTTDGESEREEETEEATESEAAAFDAQGFDTKRVQTKQGTLEELVNSLISRHAERMETIPQSLLRLAARQSKREDALQPRFQREIIRVLKRFGDAAALAAKELLTTKQSLQDMVNASIIIERVPLLSIKADLEQVYAQLYEEMFRLTEELMVVAAGAELSNPGRIQHVLMGAAHERAGLLDLTQDARTAILRSLEEARTQAMSEDDMVALVRESVPRGRWLSVETRARIIARTESRLASNIATAQAAEQMGTNRVLVLDARLGPTDLICEQTNGLVVTPQEAQLLAGTEHVSGTRAFLPLSSQSMQSGAVESRDHDCYLSEHGWWCDLDYEIRAWLLAFQGCLDLEYKNDWTPEQRRNHKIDELRNLGLTAVNKLKKAIPQLTGNPYEEMKARLEEVELLLTKISKIARH